MKEWIERDELELLARRDVRVRGRQALGEALHDEPDLLVAVSQPANPPVDVETYRTRLARSRDGDGPVLTGIEEFVDVLESLEEPASAVTITGVDTSYVLLLDADRQTILAALAIDRPSTTTSPDCGT